MAWRPAAVNKASNKTHVLRQPKSSSSSSSPTLQILAFETAKCMVRLVALYKSLSDDEFLKFRKDVMKSPGVATLNSDDETYLCGLACREMLENLDQAASVVSLLGKKCIDRELNKFDIAYHNMKQGIVDAQHLDFNSKRVGKIIEQMEKYSSYTSLLYASLVDLEEMEISERKMKKWKRNGTNRNNVNYFNEEISLRRKQIAQFRKISLWNQTYDKIIGLMARIVCVLFVRICTIFEPFDTTLPCITNSRYPMRRLYNPSPKSNEDKGSVFRLSAFTNTDKLITKNKNIEGNARGNYRMLIHSAPENTVGAAGLALRYANVIIMAETYFYSTSTTTMSKGAREYMFEMLPMNLKQTLRGKLKSHWCKDAEAREGQQGLAQRWKVALEEILGWLAPMARDTLRWQQERNLEQRNLDAKPAVLMLQTLYFSDLEKTEAAIVEILVGLSCICGYENRRKKGGV
ncbi:putative EF-TU receptor [Hibiscus syriacus]|uniref:EF-TU receptor n=1 Tax=Hibiscus syriacus TaxID=106335 RepID=A0A6A3BS02_HIBSY|nr:protein PSK SIMULATOR 1-like [Hibiscus syriacus]KAE8719433.1 putative EF-TU receptor [Hibiscus syriacus]